jgi:hypothetical protein
MEPGGVIEWVKNWEKIFSFYAGRGEFDKIEGMVNEWMEGLT